MANKKKFGLPTINITITQTEPVISSRSQRGIVYMIVRDTTEGSAGMHSYSRLTLMAADKKKYTAENYQYAVDVFKGGPAKLNIIGIGKEDTIEKTLQKYLCNTKGTGRIVVAGGTSTDHKAVADWVIEQEAKNKTWHALTYGYTSADSMHVENLSSTGVKTVTWADSERGTTDGGALLPRVAGILSGCNVTKSAMSVKFDDISKWTTAEEYDIEVDINAGNLTLWSDDGDFMLANDVNTLKTLTDDGTRTNDMRQILTVEVIDLIQDETIRIFKDLFRGKKKNSASNQANYCAEINDLFGQLEREEVLNSDYENIAAVNVDKMRQYWESAGLDTSNLTDDSVKKRTVGRDVYITEQFKVLDAIVNLDVKGTML